AGTSSDDAQYRARSSPAQRASGASGPTTSVPSADAPGDADVARLLRDAREASIAPRAARGLVGNPAEPGTHPAREAHPLPGPKPPRADLEVPASGRISTIFGPLVEQQDGYARQVRMPMPPLLLADRVTGIRGEPGSMGKGTIWTETDVGADAWYLDD